METIYQNIVCSETFDTETAYRVSQKVIWDFFRDVSIVRKHEIQDIVQESVARAFIYRRSFNPRIGRFSGWVGKIAWRYACDFLSKRKKEVYDIRFVDGEWEKVDFANPERDLIFSEQEAIIERFRNSLSDTDRSCLEMMEDGMKPREIASETGCTKGAAAARACRLRKDYFFSALRRSSSRASITLQSGSPGF